jgi:hypothetical protein
MDSFICANAYAAAVKHRPEAMNTHNKTDKDPKRIGELLAISCPYAPS